MAINIRCKNNECKADMKLSAKKCRKCGTLIPAKGKTYRVIVRMNGRRVIKTTHNLELAREIESKLKIDISRGEYNLVKKKASPSLNDVWERFLPWAKENKKSWKTDDGYYRKHLEPVFGDKELDQISPFDIEKLISKMKKGKSKHGRDYTPATIKHQIVLLSRLFSIAGKWNMYHGANPCHSVTKPKLNNQKTEFLTEEELSRLLDVLDTWPDKMSVCFIKFALFSGVRRSEQFKLEWRDIDFERRTATLRDPKGIIDQTIPLSDEALQVLKATPRRKNTPFVFYGKKGQRLTDFKKPWLNIRATAKLPSDFRFHGLRHNFASTLVSNGVPLYTVQKLLCHKNAKTTQRYAHLADHALRDAVELSGKLFKPKKKAEVVNLENVKNG